MTSLFLFINLKIIAAESHDVALKLLGQSHQKRLNGGADPIIAKDLLPAQKLTNVKKTWQYIPSSK